MKYSFILPTRFIDDYLKKSVFEILKHKRDDYEIIVAFNGDDFVNCFNERVKIIKCPKNNVSLSRNMAANISSGDFLVFIDSDAYISDNFFEVLDKNFDNNVDFLCGPNITAIEDSFLQKVFGVVLSIGFEYKHYLDYPRRVGVIMPSVNMSISKKGFVLIGGFSVDYNIASEDTNFCLKYFDYFKKGFIYDPDLFVYHHRRKTLISFFKQCSLYAIFNGKNFCLDLKIFLRNKLFKIQSILPTIFVFVFFTFFVYGLLSSVFIYFYLLNFLSYLFILYKLFFKIWKYEKDIKKLLLASVIFYVLLFIYGFNFLIGFLINKRIKDVYFVKK